MAGRDEILRSAVPANVRLVADREEYGLLEDLEQSGFDRDLAEFLEADTAVLVAGAPAGEQEAVEDIGLGVADLYGCTVYAEPGVVEAPDAQLEYEGYASTTKLLRAAEESVEEENLVVATQDYTVPRTASTLESAMDREVPPGGYLLDFQDFPEMKLDGVPRALIQPSFYRGLLKVAEEQGGSRRMGRLANRMESPDLSPTEGYDFRFESRDPSDYDALLLGADTVSSLEYLEDRMATENFKNISQPLKEAAKRAKETVTGSPPDY